MIERDAPGHDPAASAAAPPVEWRFNPWRERPRHASVALAAALAMALVVVTLGEGPVLTLALSLVGVAALAPVFTPARCRLDDDGAARSAPWGWERRRWDVVRRAVLRPGALLVSPFARPSWRDPYRALVLPMPRGDAALHAAVAAQLASHGF